MRVLLTAGFAVPQGKYLEVVGRVQADKSVRMVCFARPSAVTARRPRRRCAALAAAPPRRPSPPFARPAERRGLPGRRV